MATSKVENQILKVYGPSKYRETVGVGLEVVEDIQSRVVSVSVHTGVDAEAFKALTKSFKVINQLGYDKKDPYSKTRWVRFLAEVTIFEDDDED